MSLLLDKSFRPLFATQFWGAFNDNLFKNALVLTVTFQGVSLLGLSSDKLVALAGAVFILPFFLFSALAGQLADKYSKTTLIRWVKAAEVAIMALAAAGFVLHSVPLLFAVLFLLGLHSTVFGPLKYGIVPELLPNEQLVAGNAWVEMGTFLAILLGTIGGGLLAGLPASGVWWTALAGLGVALLGLLSAWGIPARAPVAPELVVAKGLFRPTWELVRHAAKERSILHSILGISWFWLLGAVVLSVLPSLVTVHLGGTEGVVTYLLALFSVGVAVGSLLCKRLSFEMLELGLVPIGSIGMTVFLLDAALVVRGPALQAGTTILELVGSARGLRLTFDLSLFALSSGLFIVPLYTLLQERSAEGVRARVIAANNVANAAFMVLGSLLLTGLLALGLSVPAILVVLAALNFAVALYIYTVIPEFLFRFLCFCLAHVLYRLQIQGRKRIPRHGAALLVANHVTLIDWLLLSATTQRPMRFVMHHSFTRLPLTGRLFRDAKVIPIAGVKEDPAILEAAFARVEKELADGELVCIFPEGKLTTDGQMAPFRRGVERIIAKSPVPVIPVRIDGLWQSFFSRFAPRRPCRRVWSRVRLFIGEPIAPADVTAQLLEQRVAALGDPVPAPRTA